MQDKYYHIINECEVQLWSVSQHKRIHKLMAKIGEFKPIKHLSDLMSTDKILIINAKYLFDANVFAKLVAHTQGILTNSTGQVPAAAWVDATEVDEVLPKLTQVSKDFGAISIFTPQELTGGYDPRLRKFDLSHVVEVTAEDQEIIENYLYDKSYKGITDLVTKWFWPYPARWAVRKCVALSISPNMVTSVGWLLTLFTGFAFYYGYFMVGLISAWIMTFLDTVDGKLARVTLQSSKIGHVMDHGLDIIHPPVWYWCWAVGLQLDQLTLFGFTWPVMHWFWLMFGAYVGGRIFEGLFQLLFNDISIFCWRPIDSYHRLITARRNPCLILLTIAMAMLNPVWGFIWIIAWTIISTLLLGIRFIWACTVRLFKGPLESWIAGIDPLQSEPTLATKWFTGYQAIKTIEPLTRSLNYPN